MLPLAVLGDQIAELLESVRAPPEPATRTRASRARAASTASASRSIPSRRMSGRASSRSAACPPPPTVQSTINPAGTGRRSSTTSRAITGRCENSASTSDSSTSSDRRDPGHPLPIPAPAPRSTGAARDVSPGRLRLKAGGVGARQPRRPGGWRRARRTGPARCCQCSMRAYRLHLARLREVVDALAFDDRGRTGAVALAEPLRVPESRCGRSCRRRSRRGRGRRTPAAVGGIATRPCLSGRDLDRAGEERAGGLALARAPRSRASLQCAAATCCELGGRGRRRGIRRAPSPSPLLPRAGPGSGPGG